MATEGRNPAEGLTRRVALAVAPGIADSLVTARPPALAPIALPTVALPLTSPPLTGWPEPHVIDGPLDWADASPAAIAALPRAAWRRLPIGQADATPAAP